MITLSISAAEQNKIKRFGKSILVKDNLRNYFGSDLRVYFSNNFNNNLSIFEYELPIGAGDNLLNFSILDSDKNTIFNTRDIDYSTTTVDEFLLM